MSRSAIFLIPFGLVTALVLGGCESATLDWSPVEASKTIRVDTARSVYALDFAPGAAELGPPESARLAAFVAGGGIQPADHITLAGAGGDPQLAEARRNHVAAALRRQGVGAIVSASSDPGGAPDRVTVRIERAVATLPNCPDWSKPPIDNTGAVSSNFGCANVTNLGLMVADPADLLGGRPTGPGDAGVASMAIERYRANQAWGSPTNGVGATGATPLTETGTGAGRSGGGEQ